MTKIHLKPKKLPKYPVVYVWVEIISTHVCISNILLFFFWHAFQETNFTITATVHEQ